MSFTFGCAKPLYRKHIHPRLLVGPNELEQMRQRTRGGVGKRLLAGMRTRLRPVALEILAAADDKAARAVVDGAYFGRPLWHFLDELAALGRLDQDQNCLRAVRRILLAIADAGNAGTLGHNGTGALSIVANAYDLIHDCLPDADRRPINEWMLDCGIRATLAEVRPHHFRSAGVNSAEIR